MRTSAEEGQAELPLNTSMTITVGAGGGQSGNYPQSGLNGTASSIAGTGFTTIESTRGGAGAHATIASGNSIDGGSGGGGNYAQSSGG